MTVVSPLPVLPNTEEAELDRSIILKIFSSIGRCRFLEEKHFDACTALSGAGPAFACIFLEAMTDGGVMMGLPRAEALELAAQSELIHEVGPQTRKVFTCSSFARDSTHDSASWCTSRTDQRFRDKQVFMFDRVSTATYVSCSTRRLYYRRASSNGRRQGAVDNCSSNPDCDRTRQRTRSTNKKIVAGLLFRSLQREIHSGLQ